jgi:hypothetical protein
VIYSGNFLGRTIGFISFNLGFGSSKGIYFIGLGSIFSILALLKKPVKQDFLMAKDSEGKQT